MNTFSLFLHVRCYLGNVISYLDVDISFYQIRLGQTNKQERKQTNRKQRIIFQIRLEDPRVHRLSQISHSSKAEIQPSLTLFTASKNSYHSQSYNHQTEKEIPQIVIFYEGALLHTLQNHLRTISICRLMVQFDPHSTVSNEK